MNFDQPGMFSRAEALAAGYTDNHLRRGRAEGELFTIRRGYFVRTALWRSFDAGARHLLLAEAIYRESGANTVFSHVSAAVLHGMPTWAVPLGQATFTVGRAYAGKHGRQRILHSALLPKSDVTDVGSFPVTTPARTVVDLARTLPLVPAVSLGDHALRTRLSTPDELTHALNGARNRTGIAKARRAVGSMSGRTCSAGETRSLLLLAELPLPQPLVGHWIFDADDILVGRASFVFPSAGVVGEFRGGGLYGADPVLPGLHDELRTQRLRELGWVVATWTWQDLASPRTLLDRIARAHAQAAQQPAARGTVRPQPM